MHHEAEKHVIFSTTLLHTAL